MAQQIPFNLPTREALGRDAFFVSPSNAVALATLDTCDTWPSGKLAIIGPSGAGKTHLAHVWAAEKNAKIITIDDLLKAEIPDIASQLFVALEDVDRMAHHPQREAAEHAVFHLHNLTLAEGGRLLFTASTPPNFWSLTLPDLASRMEGTSVVRISAPDDTLLAAMLVKQFEDRQITVSNALITYLLKRMERSTCALRALVEKLDQEALAQGTAITRNLAARLFDDTTET